MSNGWAFLLQSSLRNIQSINANWLREENRLSSSLRSADNNMQHPSPSELVEYLVGLCGRPESMLGDVTGQSRTWEQNRSIRTLRRTGNRRYQDISYGRAMMLTTRKLDKLTKA